MQVNESTIVNPGDIVANSCGRVQIMCSRAKELAEAGEFEIARSTLLEFWSRVGERPRLDGLDESTQAELLLRAGALSGWIGSAHQIWGAQELAKDLISESATLFEKLGMDEKVAEARIDLAICYWREGGYDEARVTLQQILQSLGDQPSEQRLRALLNCGLVERSSLRYHDALRIHHESAALFNESTNHALRGKFHNEFATVLKDLGLAERREEYIDQSLVEYAAASFHAEQAGNNRRFLAQVKNNVAFLFVSIGRFNEAHHQLDQARSLFEALKDRGMVAQLDDTRARAFIDQGLFAEAEAVAGRSVRVLEEGDELSLLAEALTTHGRALAKLGDAQLAHSKFSEALATAQRAGDPESAGVAVLSISEELGGYLPQSDLCSYYRMAESLLAESQYPEVKVRLGEFARRLMAVPLANTVVEFPIPNGNGSAKESAAGTLAFSNSRPDGNLEQLVLNYEGELIRRALEASGGSVTRAARLLGITHQGLAFILNGRHRNLLSVRTPVKPRRRSIMRHR